MNNEAVSRRFEIGAPDFERRLEAAYQVQHAGYPLRIRLDPIVPFDGWKNAYSETVKRIFQRILPERLTLGTLRFEKGFYAMRKSIFMTGAELPAIMEGMMPMFDPKCLRAPRNRRLGNTVISKKNGSRYSISSSGR